MPLTKADRQTQDRALNGRSFAVPTRFRACRSVIKDYDPDVVFISRAGYGGVNCPRQDCVDLNALRAEFSGKRCVRLINRLCLPARSHFGNAKPASTNVDAATIDQRRAGDNLVFWRREASQIDRDRIVPPIEISASSSFAENAALSTSLSHTASTARATSALA